MPAPARSQHPDSPLLSFAGVCSSRRNGNHDMSVLENVSFQLRAGAGMGIYGARRSGKSTLLRLAVGLQSPERGRVLIEGREPARMGAAERTRLLRGPLALLAAGGWLPSPGETVMDHVAMSAGSAGLSLRDARRRALETLDRVAVAAVSAEEMTIALSATQRARVELARALAREPALLVVDEPAPLPSLLERERFLALLREVARERGIALLVASEELSALQGLGELASLSAGELFLAHEPGTVVELASRRAAVGERR